MALAVMDSEICAKAVTGMAWEGGPGADMIGFTEVRMWRVTNGRDTGWLPGFRRTATPNTEMGNRLGTEDG